MSIPARGPVLLVSHGAATLTVRPEDPTQQALRAAAPLLDGCAAVLMLSAHHVASAHTVATAPRVAMQADHPAAAGLSWSAPGHPGLAADLLDLLQGDGIDACLGEPFLDHGAWLPLRALDPQGRLPLVTLSLARHFDAAAHLALGQALAPLRQRGVAIVASGGITHNQERFRQGWFSGEPVATPVPASARFEQWALDALLASDRAARLLRASAHPDYAWAHPTPDHWLPTLVAAGAAGQEPARVLHRGAQHGLGMAMVAW